MCTLFNILPLISNGKTLIISLNYSLLFGQKLWQNPLIVLMTAKFELEFSSFNYFSFKMMFSTYYACFNRDNLDSLSSQWPICCLKIAWFILVVFQKNLQIFLYIKLWQKLLKKSKTYSVFIEDWATFYFEDHENTAALILSRLDTVQI